MKSKTTSIVMKWTVAIPKKQENAEVVGVDVEELPAGKG
jgi:hypothetical protein